MNNYKLDVLGRYKTHWYESGHLVNGSTVYFSGYNTKNCTGVVIVIPKRLNIAVMGYWPTSMYIILNSSPKSMLLHLKHLMQLSSRRDLQQYSKQRNNTSSGRL